MFILWSLHVVPKSTIIAYVKVDQSYDSIIQVQWILEKIVKNNQATWHASLYFCIKEMMVPYNDKYCSF